MSDISGASVDLHKALGGSADLHKALGGSADLHKALGGSADLQKVLGGSAESIRWVCRPAQNIRWFYRLAQSIRCDGHSTGRRRQQRTNVYPLGRELRRSLTGQQVQSPTRGRDDMWDFKRPTVSVASATRRPTAALHHYSALELGRRYLGAYLPVVVGPRRRVEPASGACASGACALCV